MLTNKFSERLKWFLVACYLLLNILPQIAVAKNTLQVTPSNFGLPGIIDLPTAKRFPDGEIC